MSCKHFFDESGLCRRCEARKPAKPNGEWPRGTYLQTRLAEILRRTADEIEGKEVQDETR